MKNADLRDALMGSRPISIDLFSGVGGLSLGLELAGFFGAVHVEIEEQASRYAAYNFPLARHLAGPDAGNVRTLTGAGLLQMTNGREIDVIAGGPPCQGFSRAGRRRVDDPMNDLVLEMARVILEAKPKSFIIENVPGIQAGQYWQFDKALEQLGADYTVSAPTLLKAEDFGVPQIRRRVFTVGIRRDLEVYPHLPHPTHSIQSFQDSLYGAATPNVGDALNDIPNCDDYEHLFDGDTTRYEIAPSGEYSRLMRDAGGLLIHRGYEINWNSAECTNLRRTRHGPELLAKLRDLQPGAVEKTSRIPRLRADGLGMTVRAGTTSERGSWSAPRPCHPTFPRVLTTRESARIQSFPDWFRFHPVKWHGNRQVGNAVPPLLGMAVGSALLKDLGHEQHLELVGTATRDESLIEDDVRAAAESNNSRRKASHSVSNTNLASRSLNLAATTDLVLDLSDADKERVAQPPGRTR